MRQTPLDFHELPLWVFVAAKEKSVAGVVLLINISGIGKTYSVILYCLELSEWSGL